MKKYTYVALFSYDTDGYTVTFPDLDGIITCGSNVSEAIEMAKDALEVGLLAYEDNNIAIPSAREFSELKHLLKNEKDFIQYIEADTYLARKKEENKSIKKTLTIPSWLNDIAVRKKINFSQLLQNALKEELNL